MKKIRFAFKNQKFETNAFPSLGTNTLFVDGFCVGDFEYDRDPSKDLSCNVNIDVIDNGNNWLGLDGVLYIDEKGEHHSSPVKGRNILYVDGKPRDIIDI